MGGETVINRKKKRLARGRALRQARIFAHLREDSAAANLGLKHANRAADGPAQSEDFEAASGKEEEKEKNAPGVGASL